jgi:Bacterial mobilisation protein (MobC).
MHLIIPKTVQKVSIFKVLVMFCNTISRHYIRKMAIDGYYIHIDFSELLEIIKLLKIDSNNINQIAKVANSCGTVDGKTISDMKENHERILKKVEKTFNKYLDIY